MNNNLKSFPTIFVLIISALLFLTFNISALIKDQLFTSLWGLIAGCLLTLWVIKYRVLEFPKKTTILILLFLLWMIASLTFTQEMGSSVWEVLRMLIFFTFFITFYNLFKFFPYSQKFFLIAFLVISFLVLSKDLYLFFSSGKAQSGGYLTGSLSWHNQTAGFLLLVIPILLSLLLNIKGKIKVFLFIYLLMALVAIIFTYSRGGWVSLALSLPVFIFFVQRKLASFKKILIPGLIIIFLVTPLLLNQTKIYQRLSSITQDIISNQKTTSGNLRVSVWQDALKIVEDYPILGIGPGAFGTVFHHYQSKPWLYAKYSHNQFLDTAIELGIPGLILFTSILFSILMPVFRTLKTVKKDGQNFLVIGVFVASIASILHALIDIDWSWLNLYTIFWLFLALLLANSKIETFNYQFIGSKKVAYLIPLGITIIFLPLLMSESFFKQAQEYRDEKKLEQAEVLYKKALNFERFDSRLFYALAEVYRDKNSLEEAKDSFGKSREFNKFDSDSLRELGIIDYKQGRYQEAKKNLERSIALVPYSDPEVYQYLSDSYLQLGEEELAKKVLERAVFEIFPLNENYRGFEYLYRYVGFHNDLTEVYVRLIDIYLQDKEKEKASQLLAVIEKDLNPTHTSIPQIKEILK